MRTPAKPALASPKSPPAESRAIVLELKQETTDRGRSLTPPPISGILPTTECRDDQVQNKDVGHDDCQHIPKHATPLA